MSTPCATRTVREGLLYSIKKAENNEEFLEPMKG